MSGLPARTLLYDASFVDSAEEAGVRGPAHVVTWGALQGMTTGFFSKYCDEAIVYLSEESLTNGKSPEAFDYASLQADLAALK